MGRDLRIIFSARVLMSAARALAAVAAPVYLAEEGFSAIALGALFLTVALTSAVFSTTVGLLSDRTGRRVFMVTVPLLAAVAAVVFAVTRSTGVLVAAAAIGSFGRGSGAGSGTVGPYQPAESALTLEVVPSRRRNDAFGRLAFGSAAGALVGGLLALSAPAPGLRGAAAFAGYRPVFVAAAALAVGAGILALWLHEPARRPPADGARPRTRFPRRSLPLLVKLWATNSVNGLAVGMFAPFITYWLYRRYGVGAGEIGVLFAVINAASAASTLAAASVARRFGLVRTVATVRAVNAVLLVPMVLAPSFVLAGAVYLVRMTVQRVGLPLRQSYAVTMAHPEERASVAALSTVPSQVAMSASPVLSGWILDSVSLELPFEIAGALQFLNAALYWLFFRRLPPGEERVAMSGEGAAG
jgi:MFS family permease